MSVSVSMPQLGESVTEGTVTRWLKREGEHVDADEPLLEVSTDKVDTEIPSPVSGVLRGITDAEDETVAVGAELAVIEEDGARGAGGGEQGAADSGANTPQPAQAAVPAAQDPYPPRGHDEPGPGYQRTDQPPVYPPPGYDDPRQAGPGSPAAGQPGYQPGYYQQSGYEQPGHQQQGYQQPGYQPADQPGYQQPGQPGYQAPARDPYTQPASYPPGQPAGYPPYGYPQQADGQPGQAAPPGAGQADRDSASPASAGGDGAAGDSASPASAAPEGTGADAKVSGGSDGSQAERGGADQAGQPQQAGQGGAGPAGLPEVMGDGADGPYVTPLVRKLAAEHGIDLARVTGTGVGGRIRKQDVLDAARVPGGAAPAGPGGQPDGPGQPAPGRAAAGQPAGAVAPAAMAGPAAPQGTAAEPGAAAAGGPPVTAAPPAPAASAPRPPVKPSSLRGRTERLSRARQVIAQRMVESLQTAAQLTTVIEADVTAIARLRDRAKTAFEAREGVKLSFLPFFALAAVEALKVHPELNAVIDQAAGAVTYHDAEHLGIAVDTERGLMVPVIRNAGDLNIGGLARKIADLAQRTRAGQVSPDDLAGGTFTLTNTGSRGALFDTPIINQPQVGILGTGTVDRRAVVVQEPALGEVITVRSIVHLALTYDHRLVDGADAARFLVTVKNRLEEGSFEAELGL